MDNKKVITGVVATGLGASAGYFICHQTKRPWVGALIGGVAGLAGFCLGVSLFSERKSGFIVKDFQHNDFEKRECWKESGTGIETEKVKCKNPSKL